MSKRRQRFAPSGEPVVEVRDLARENAVDRVRRRIGELVEPWVTTVVQGSGEQARAVRIEHPCLIDQLHAGGAPSTAGVSGGPGSRPPASLEAASLLREIDGEVLEWGRALTSAAFLAGLQVGAGSTRRRTLALLGVLARRAPVLPEDTLDALDHVALRWWGRARVATSWDREPIKMMIPCGECQAVGKVRVRLDPLVAVCLECHAAWDDRTIGALGQQVHILTRVGQEPDLVAAVVDRGRGRGWAGANLTRSPGSVGELLAGLGPDRPWPDAPTSTGEEADADAVV